MAEVELEKKKDARKFVERKFVETIYLDTYDDLFSDFDYGIYETRRISGDLTDELESRLVKADSDKIELIFAIPESERKKDVEAMAKKRLRQVFVKKARSIDSKINVMKNTGSKRILIGAAIIGCEWIAAAYADPSSLLYLASLWIAPPGWFFAFTGLELLFDESEKPKKRRDLYRVLSDASITFEDESKLVGKSEPVMPKLAEKLAI